VWSVFYFFKDFFYKYFFLFSVTIIFITIFILSNKTLYFQSTLDESLTEIDLFEKNFKKINELTIKNPQNLILVLLESYDNDFIKSLDKDIYNQINDLKFKNFNTYDLNYLYTSESAKISLKAQVEYLCGIYLQFNKKNYNKSNFFENHLCIQDIFRLNNYNTELVMNSPITFHSSHRFFLEHYFDNVYDSNYFNEQTLFDKNSHSFFSTVNDEDIFLFSKKRLTTLSNQEQNYFLTIVTLDTHAPGIYYDKDKCKPYTSKPSNTNLNNIKDSIFTKKNLSSSHIDKINSFKCTNTHLIDFLNFIDESNLDTNIFLVGDHGYLNDKKQRKLYNKIITKKKFNINDKDKFYPLDIFPTLLEISGYKMDNKKIYLGYSAIESNNLPKERNIIFDSMYLNFSKSYNELW